ncbi:carboxypeptidase-like regulatory domain-containing protein [Candidatus Laterigemmans baculatus]|uniref:carboxypeptidase-like regulatory domain-containing protein n=1 Tax=Candidatus Laterigemmans baculatus TaxID=2770505 RepID=UPI0013DAC827|nr:carboxypeptidase-like regulatory domain-containing protein [Candidatus Laterigemmans baculatus]
MRVLTCAAAVLTAMAIVCSPAALAEQRPELEEQPALEASEGRGTSPVPTNVPLPTKLLKSFAAFPPSGSGLRVKIDDRRWVELVALASHGEIGGEDVKVFWTAGGELINPPANFDPRLLVPDAVDGEMPGVNREVLLQVVGPVGFDAAMQTSGHGGYSRMKVPVDEEFEQMPLNYVMSDIGSNHAYIEVRVSGEEWEEVPDTGGTDVQWLTQDDGRRVYVLTANARDFAWVLNVQRDGEASVAVTPSMVGGTVDLLAESLQESVAEDHKKSQVVAFFFQKDKPLPTKMQLKRSRFDLVRFENLSVFPGPRSAVRVSVNGVPVPDQDQLDPTEEGVAEAPPATEEGVINAPLELVTIKGLVEDENGQPLQGCWVGMFTNRQEFDAREESQAEFDHLPEFAGEAYSTADGTFTILAPKTHFVFDGSFWAVSRDGATGTLALNATWSYTQRQLKITVPDEEGTVRVVDPEGNPVAGADVTLEAIKAPHGVTRRLPALVRKQQTMKTDGDGRVVFRGRPSAAIRGVSIRTDGYGTQYLSERLVSAWVEGDEALTLRLQPTAALVGRVEGFDAREHPGLKLQILTEPREGRPPLHGRAVVEIEEDGSFGVERIAAGRVSFASSLSPDSPSKIRLPSVSLVKPGERRVLAENPQLEPAVLVRQRIVESDTGEGIPDVKLRVLWGSAVEGRSDWSQSKATRTDEHGWWSAKVLPGRINIRISSIPEGYKGTAWFDGRAGYLGVEATVPASDQIVTLPPERYVPSRELTGRLQYADGTPAEDWSIYGHPISWDDVGVGGVHTKADGSFTWTYPVGYPPRFYKASNREWMTKYDFTDRYVVPTVISADPLVLEIPVGKRD